jgi:hypothetical protein
MKAKTFNVFAKKKPAEKAGFVYSSAGSLLQGSNPKKGKNAANQPYVKEGKNSVRFTEDLIKIHEFYKIYIREITAILERANNNRIS